MLAAGCALASQVAAAQPEPLPCNAFSESGVEQAMQAVPGHDVACHARGMLLIRDATRYGRQLDAAEMIFRTLLLLRPQQSFAYMGFAELKMRRRELDAGADDSLQVIHDEAERATRTQPVIPEAFVTLGRADLLMGCVPCAQRSVETARALRADSVGVAELRARIAEADDSPGKAATILRESIAAPGLAREERAWLSIKLAEVLVRGGLFEEADRALGDAIAARPSDATAHLRLAQVRLLGTGDVAGALRAADGNRAAGDSVEIKRVRAMAQYVQWSRDRLAGRPVADLRRLAQASYLGPEDALVMCARYPALLREFEVMLAAGLVRGVDSRDEAGDTALLAAAAGANIRAASLLVDQGANVDAADRRGRRPLTFAIERANPELQGMLLRSGAKMDYVDMDGRSPLMLAVQKGDSASAAALLRNHAQRKTAGLRDPGELLAVAAARGDVQTLRVVLDAGAAVDARDRNGRTALIWAVSMGHYDAAHLLLERNAEAARALDAARERGNPAMMDLLRTYLKRPS
jgi:hypothetical protein